VFPRFRTYKEFPSRYDWQQLDLYHIALVTPHDQLIRERLGCAMNRYAEVKAITEGETSVVGSLEDKCIEGLARNLDFASALYGAGSFGKEKLSYKVFPLELDEKTLAGILDGLDTQELASVIVHLAEGKATDASSAREFADFKARGLLRKGVSIIHGVALKEQDLREMSEKEVALIWAPRSNFELYGATADVEAALRERVTVALSPDWSPTGSQGMLQELVFANTWSQGKADPAAKKEAPLSSKELVRMATEYPAKLAGLGERIGTLEAGHAADMVVLRKRATGMDAYDTVVHANPEDVELVIINGDAVYGRPGLMKTLLPSQELETLPVCGEEKAISFASESKAQAKPAKTWKQTTEELSMALRAWGTSLGPIADCAN
jgi:5-methylthioadenosine/S-adenosylhomocysteine deaminase